MATPELYRVMDQGATTASANYPQLLPAPADSPVTQFYVGKPESEIDYASIAVAPPALPAAVEPEAKGRAGRFASSVKAFAKSFVSPLEIDAFAPPARSPLSIPPEAAAAASAAAAAALSRVPKSMIPHPAMTRPVVVAAAPAFSMFPTTGPPTTAIPTAPLEPNYGTRSALTYAALAPPQAAVSPAETRYNALFQEIANHCRVLDLQRQALTSQRLIAAGIQLVDFYNGAYTLAEMAALLPSYGELKQLGLNKYLLGERWSIHELAQLYRLPLGSVCADLQFTAADLLRTKITLPQMVELGLTADRLLQMGANFEFLLQLHITPRQFANELKGSYDTLAQFQLTRNQKEALGKACGWTPFGMCGVMGFTSKNVNSLWYPLGNVYLK